MTTQWGDRTPLDAHYRKRGHDGASPLWKDALKLAALAAGLALFWAAAGIAGAHIG